LQVEYAKKTVQQGSTSIGVVCNDGIVILAEKKMASKLVILEGIDKIYEIDTHIIASFAGITSDARVLMERAQSKAQQHRITFETSADMISIVKDISDLKQYTTQSGGLRPFGVALIIGGYDTDGPKLFVTDPTGIYFRYKAAVIGEFEEKIEEILAKEYKDSMTVNDGIKLALKALKEVSEEFNIDRIDCAYIGDDRKIVHPTKAQLQKLM
jgi:proteasome alpha subunit